MRKSSSCIYYHLTQDNLCFVDPKQSGWVNESCSRKKCKTYMNESSKVLISAKKVHVALPEKSIQRKVILAILCNCMMFMCAKQVLGIGRVAFDTAERHYHCLSSSTPIVQPVCSIMSFGMHQVV
jgi:hypothetical protein